MDDLVKPSTMFGGIIAATLITSAAAVVTSVDLA
jgi:hypothetical protein